MGISVTDTSIVEMKFMDEDEIIVCTWAEMLEANVDNVEENPDRWREIAETLECGKAYFFEEQCPSELRLKRDSTMIHLRKASQADDYECQCGNTADDDGFDTCDVNGFRMRRVPFAPKAYHRRSTWAGHYICVTCGRISLVLDDEEEVAK